MYALSVSGRKRCGSWRTRTAREARFSVGPRRAVHLDRARREGSRVRPARASVREVDPLFWDMKVDPLFERPARRPALS